MRIDGSADTSQALGAGNHALLDRIVGIPALDQIAANRIATIGVRGGHSAPRSLAGVVRGTNRLLTSVLAHGLNIISD